jgi:hypothetical protein
MTIHQTGQALAYVLLMRSSVPWPLLSLMLALGTMAIWWDSTLETAETDLGQAAGRPKWTELLSQQFASWRTAVLSYVTARIPLLARWQESRLVRHGSASLPFLALASLAGAPLTIGAAGRWRLYATLLEDQKTTLLFITLAADTLLAAGLWVALGTILKQARDRRPSLAASLAMLPLAILTLATASASHNLVDKFGFKPTNLPDVSVWGLGLVFALPWLLGGWLARVKTRLERYLGLLQRAVDLDWLYDAASQFGRRLAGIVYWLGQVGEGEGWWGWALIVLALGVLFLTAR